MGGDRRIILDCDPGVDDALALALALQSKRVELAAVTTVCGNLPVSRTTLNACRILDYFGSDTPVARGASKPLRVPPLHARPVHGTDGLGDSPLLPPRSPRRVEHEDAEAYIASCVESGARTIVATGPLTNIALAFQRHKKAMEDLEGLIIMGGSIHVPGNTDSLSEFNFYADPDAADYVLRGTGVPKVLVPLDATHQVILTRAGLEEIGDSAAGRLAKSILPKYQSRYIDSGFAGSPLHDPLAVGFCLDSKFLELQPMFVRVETAGAYTRGTCVPEERPSEHKRPNVMVGLRVDSERFLRYFKEVLSR